MSPKILQSGSRQKERYCEKNIYKKSRIPRISIKKLVLKQLNVSEEVEEYKNTTIHKKLEKIPEKCASGKSDRCENKFIHLEHQHYSL